MSTRSTTIAIQDTRRPIFARLYVSRYYVRQTRPRTARDTERVTSLNCTHRMGITLKHHGGNARFKHRQDAPNLLHPRPKLGCQFVWRQLVDNSVLVEAQRANPDVCALWVTIRVRSPSAQHISDALHLVVPAICDGRVHCLCCERACWSRSWVGTATHKVKAPMQMHRLQILWAMRRFKLVSSLILVMPSTMVNE